MSSLRREFDQRIATCKTIYNSNPQKGFEIITAILSWAVNLPFGDNQIPNKQRFSMIDAARELKIEFKVDMGSRGIPLPSTITTSTQNPVIKTLSNGSSNVVQLRPRR